MPDEIPIQAQAAKLQYTLRGLFIAITAFALYLTLCRVTSGALQMGIGFSGLLFFLGFPCGIFATYRKSPAEIKTGGWWWILGLGCIFAGFQILERRPYMPELIYLLIPFVSVIGLGAGVNLAERLLYPGRRSFRHTPGLKKWITAAVVLGMPLIWLGLNVAKWVQESDCRTMEARYGTLIDTPHQKGAEVGPLRLFDYESHESVKFTADTDDQLAQLRDEDASRVQEMELGKGRITDRGLPYIGRCRNLKSLDLSSQKITDEGLKSIGMLVNLETLDLSNTLIGDEGLEHLMALQKLRSLRLSNTRCSDEKFDELRRHLSLPTYELTRIRSSSSHGCNL